MDDTLTGGGKRGRGAKKNTVSRPRSASPVKTAKRSPSRKPSRKPGSKGGIDLTPFLTSLLLLGSRMAFDKKNPSAAFSRLLKSAKKGLPKIAKGRIVKKTKNGVAKKPQRNYRGGSSAEDMEENILEMFNNTDPDVGVDNPLANMQEGGGRRRRSRSPKRKSPTASKRSKSPKRSASPVSHNGGKAKAAKPKATKAKATKPKATKPKATKAKATKPKATKAKATKPKATKPKGTRAPRSPRRI
jgi:hypothetical protein